MKKNTIIYIVAGVVAVAGIATAGVFAVSKFLGGNAETSEPTLNYNDYADFGVNGYEILETPSAEYFTNENGEIVEYQTDANGNTIAVPLETDANGVPVTNAAGEFVTKKTPANQSTTKPGATTTTAPAKKPNTSTTKPASNGNSAQQGLSGGNTVQTNPDGSKNIIKPDGTIALSYSYSAAGNYFYTDEDPWQRNFGFNRLYDIGAVFTVMYLDTFHVYYNHGGYDWMVQFWKGQYGLLFLGGEIGLYYKDPGKSTQHFKCAEENMEINMQMTVYREGYGELFTRPYAPHWWTTAFVPGKLKKFSDRTELTMIAKIQFKSVEEREKFCAALEKIKDVDGNRFTYAPSISKNKPEHYTYNGSTVDIVWRYLDEDRVTPLKAVPTTTSAPKTTEKTTKKPVVTNPPVVESAPPVIESNPPVVESTPPDSGAQQTPAETPNNPETPVVID